MRHNRSEDGVALLAVLVLASVLAICASVFVRSAVSLRKATGMALLRAKNHSAARSGIELAIATVRFDSSAQDATTVLGSSAIQVVIKPVAGEEQVREVVSTARTVIGDRVDLVQTVHARIAVTGEILFLVWE